MYKWKPTMAEARDFAERMKEIRAFCKEHGIRYSKSMDSYYFTINGKEYRVSNHTVKRSNSRAWNSDGIQIRETYHLWDYEERVTCITAGKTRIIEIYNDLAAGYQLNRRGYRVNE